MLNRISLFFLPLLLLTSSILSAQSKSDSTEEYIHKHQFLIGIFFNFSNEDNTTTSVDGTLTGTSTYTYSGDLTAGFVTGRRTAVLVKGGYSDIETLTYENIGGKNISLQDHNVKSYVTPIFRYHVPVLDGNYFLLQFRVPVSFGTYVTESYNSNTQTIRTDTYNKTGIGFYLVPGFTTFISKRFAAEIAAGSFGWETYDGTDNHGHTAHTGGFQSLLYLNSVSLGFVFYL
jgi:hypothetical protein